MTALVGILNKRAAVIAADSAVTTTRGETKKINNTANKIFRLSNTHPVGVMICGNSEYMGIPWEVLFKLYRDTGRDKPFDTLMEYVDDFLKFLRNETHCCDKEAQDDYLASEISSFYYKMKELCSDDYDEAENNEDPRVSDKEKLMKTLLEDNFKLLDTRSDEAGVCPDFEKYTFKSFIVDGKDVLDRLENTCRDEKMPGTRKEWEEHCFKQMRSKLLLGRETGLVFVGYGEQSIYPSLIPVNMAGYFNGKIRYYINQEDEEHITNENNASICPFAQTDIMISLLKGIHPLMADNIFDKLSLALDKAKQKMLETLSSSGVEEATVEKMNAIDFDEIDEQFRNDVLNFIRTSFTDGVVDAVDSFNIFDMVKMAESLISITNLQRHFSSSEESVGGPVDVAVITKSEGFVWVNRKQWYQKDLNPQQIERR